MSIFRFLPGIVILQIATAALTFAAADGSGLSWGIIGLMAMIVTLTVAFWFVSIAEHLKKDALAQAAAGYAREREQLLIGAEAEKLKVVEESHRHIVTETNRAHAKANFKLGAAFIGILCAGAVMLSIQFFTLGFLTLAAASGALGGYILRGRQQRLAEQKKAARLALGEPYPSVAIEGRTMKRPGSKRTP